MRLSIAITIFSTLAVLALPVVQKESSGVSLAARDSEPFASEGSLYSRALTAAQKAAKATRGAAAKEANQKANAGKTPEQIKSGRKDRKDQQKADKAVKATNAKSKPNYKSHEQKIKDKSKVTFSNGAAKRLTDMGLHGKDRKAAKKYHTNIMKSEMKKNGAAKGNVVATAHDGGTVAAEKNHITAQFTKADGRNIPSSWTDSKTGAVKTGEKDQHHVYTEGKKAPKAWTAAVDASKTRKAAEEATKKAEEDKLRDAKVKKDQAAGEETQKTISAEDKKAQREAKKAAKADRKAKATTSTPSTST